MDMSAQKGFSRTFGDLSRPVRGDTVFSRDFTGAFVPIRSRFTKSAEEPPSGTVSWELTGIPAGSLASRGAVRTESGTLLWAVAVPLSAGQNGRPGRSPSTLGSVTRSAGSDKHEWSFEN